MADPTPRLFPVDDPPSTSPLDTPQEFSGAGSHQVRDELGELIERDLLGPWDGEAELPDVLTPQSLGRIWASSMGLSFAVPGEPSSP